jgi:rhodanese-related sulfurtransferase
MTGSQSHRHTTFQGINRRGALHAGLLGLGGLSLPDFLRQQAGAGETAAGDTAVIFLFLHGGPSQLETYDLKPAATREVRGPFQPISTSVADLQLCELLPLHAKIADRFTLIRSCTHGDGGHFEAHGRFMSGNPGLKPGTFESTHPQMGAIVGRALKSRVRGVPAAVGMGLVIYQSAFGQYLPGIGNGYWSSAWRPPIVTEAGLPNATLTIDGEHLNDRVNLLRQFDRVRREIDIRGVMESVDEFNRTAIEILTADKVRQAFDLAQEDPRLVAQYGDEWGRNALVARRLVEAGVSFVTISVPGGVKAMDGPGWDDHAINIDLPTIMRHRLPVYDQVVSTLINDIYDRGLDKRVLVVAAGEFGRTPTGNLATGTTTKKLQWGREHWPGAQSILISGGGFRMGQVIGATDRHAAYPVERPLDPQDLMATIYKHLGIDLSTHFPDASGRPVAITTGTPISELS